MAAPMCRTGVQIRCSSFVPFRSSTACKNRNARISTYATHKASDLGAARAAVSVVLFGGNPAWAADIADGLNEAAQGLRQISVPDVPSPEAVARELPAASGNFLDLFADNPVIIAGLAFLALVPVALSFLGGGSLGVKTITAANALTGLGEDPTTVLIDIRSKEEVKEQGSPDLASVKKRSTPLPFTKTVNGETSEDDTWVEKFNSLRSIKPESTIILLDSYGREGKQAAKLLAKLAGRVYYVQGGAVGPSGWKEAGLPWKEPGKAVFNLDNLAADFKAQPTVAKAGLAAGAVGVAALVLFQEASTVVELAAAAAAGAFVLPRFLSSSSGTESGTRKQVRSFVEESSAAGKKLIKGTEEAGQETKKALNSDTGRSVQDAAKKAASKVEDGVKGLASETKATAKEAANGAEPAARDTVGKAEETVKEAAKSGAEATEDVAKEADEAAKESAEEARTWIENWRQDNKSS